MSDDNEIRQHLLNNHNIETRVGPASKWDKERLEKSHTREHLRKRLKPGYHPYDKPLER
jgi:hypothetical protein